MRHNVPLTTELKFQNLRHALLMAGIVTTLLPTAPSHAQQLAVRELWRTNGDPATILFMGITGMAEAADGSIWVSDMGSLILALDSTLSVRQVARKGDGPGEVRGPSRMSRTPDGGLAVFDILRGSIELFDSSGNFERRVQLGFRIINGKGFVVLPNGEFVLSGGVMGGQYLPGGEIAESGFSIHRFSRDGEPVQSWWPIRETRDPHAGRMVAGGPVAVLPDGSILFSDASPHQIFRFSTEGAKRELLAADPQLLKAIGDDFITKEGSGPSGSISYAWDFPQSRLVASMPSGEILNVVEFHNANRTLFQLYTPAGAPITQTWVDTAYTAFSITRNGDLLARWTDPQTHEDYLVRLEIRY